MDFRDILRKVSRIGSFLLAWIFLLLVVVAFIFLVLINVSREGVCFN